VPNDSYSLDVIFLFPYTGVVWEVEHTDQFEEWWNELTEDQQVRIAAVVDVLQEKGPNLKRPLVGSVEGSRIGNLKELVIPGSGDDLRVLFVFDPRRAAILLLGGDKTGLWKAWYPQAIADAERLYDEHLDELRKEGLIE
jgi:hypothetical protein